MRPAGPTPPGSGWGPPAEPGPPVDPGPPACYEHPDRPAGALCRRCERPICPDCMREAPVGWQCRRCVHDDSKRAPVTRWRPTGGTLGASRLTPVVVALVALNVAVFLYEETDLASVELRFALIPALTRGEPYRLITAAFLHADVTHILLNMVSLVIIGPAVETAIGRTRFLALYLIAAFGAEVATYLVGPLGEVSLGASGAIFGLFGAYFVFARTRRWDTQLVLGLIVVNLIYSFIAPDIDWRAHVGGLLVGAAVARLLIACERLPRATRPRAEAAAMAGVLAGLVALSFVPPGHVGI